MSKVWLVSGCSTGFGKVLAEMLCGTDARLVATARDVKSLAHLPKSDRLLVLALDVTKASDVAAAVAGAVQKFGRIDVLVNNAGYGVLGAVEETPMDALRRMFEVNVFGLYALTQAVLPQMRKQGGGYIINMSSVAGLAPTAGLATYNATKYAVEGLGQGLALEVAPFGIKVTNVEPGPFKTDFQTRSLDVMPGLPAYAEGPLKATRTYVKNLAGKQPGDPERAARILIGLAEMETPPLHLPLGNAAVDRARTKATTFLTEITANEALSRSADYPKT